ncbi:MAG: hypothetical protein KDA68_04110 [Planctomycetaceae bacterium]|nr:hypothetical protein [Planctomycetaceae bacterium]
MPRRYPTLTVAALTLFAAVQLLNAPRHLNAGVMTKAATEAAEYVIKTFGKEAADQGVKNLAEQAERLAVKHGDEALTAFRKVGPQAVKLIDDAGEQAPLAVKLLSQHGDEAAWLVSKPDRLARVAQYGDDAAEALIKHNQVALPLIDDLGKPAAQAMKALSKQEGRQLAMLASDGTLKQIGRTDELLAVVSKYGDKAMSFIWRNKALLIGGTLLASFLNDPEPYIEGIIKPVASIPGQVAAQAAASIDWTLIASIVILLAAAFVAYKVWKHETGKAKASPNN